MGKNAFIYSFFFLLGAFITGFILLYILYPIDEFNNGDMINSFMVFITFSGIMSSLLIANKSIKIAEKNIEVSILTEQKNEYTILYYEFRVFIDTFEKIKIQYNRDKLYDLKKKVLISIFFYEEAKKIYDLCDNLYNLHFKIRFNNEQELKEEFERDKKILNEMIEKFSFDFQKKIKNSI